MPTSPSSNTDSSAPESVYRRLSAEYEAEAAVLRGRSMAMARGRLVTFLGSIVCLGPAIVGTQSPRVPWLVGAAVLFVAFAVLVAVDARLSRRIARLESLRDINDRSLARRAVELPRLLPCPPVDELFPREAGQADGKAGEGAREGTRGETGAEPAESPARATVPSGAAPGAGIAPDLPAFARDLGLFGKASLFRLVSTAHTPVGRRTLARWLVEPAAPAVIAARQAAVRTLAARLAFRQEIEALAYRVSSGDSGGGSDPDLERFYAWAEGEPWLGRHPVRLWTARLLTLLVPGGLLAAVAGAVPWSLWLLVAMAGYLLSAASTGRLHDIYDRATVGGDGLRGYGPLLRALEELPRSDGEDEDEDGERVGQPAAGADGRTEAVQTAIPEGPDDLLRDLAARLQAGEPGSHRGTGRPGKGTGHQGAERGEGGEGRTGRRESEGGEGTAWAAGWMDRLERLTVLSDTRRGLIFFFVQVLTLWDFHLAARFEAWQRAAGPAVRGWLEAVGEVEALCSLAALAHAQPEWAWPRVGKGVDAGSDSFRALTLGHPLIPGDRRVGNDVEVGPTGTFLLVTGSNMSGKTTLLRAIGVNAVLAEAGGPVCAQELSMPPVRLATSIVVEDSLEDGVSFFMAELLRLKSVVDAAADAAGPDKADAANQADQTDQANQADQVGGGRRLLYLLDEVLRGTNSAERRVAIQRVLHRLLELGALGAVTTHDLQILAEGELERSAVSIHFRETIRPRPEGGADMTFDFVARPGLAPTTNALRLLEAVGLGDAREGGAAVEGHDPAGAATVQEDRAGLSGPPEETDR